MRRLAVVFCALASLMWPSLAGADQSVTVVRHAAGMYGFTAVMSKTAVTAGGHTPEIPWNPMGQLGCGDGISQSLNYIIAPWNRVSKNADGTWNMVAAEPPGGYQIPLGWGCTIEVVYWTFNHNVETAHLIGQASFTSQ